MNNLLTLVLTLSLSFLAVSQVTTGPAPLTDTKPVPPAPEVQDTEVQAEISRPPSNIWECNFDFYINGQQLYTELLSNDDTESYRRQIPQRYDNRIDEFSWEGTRCFCWVVFYQSRQFQGLNIGFWTSGESGQTDLSNYNTYDFTDRRWERWDTVVSSYSIYCY